MKTKTISEYNFTKTLKYANLDTPPDTITWQIKVRINHVAKTYDICSTYRDMKFNFQGISGLQYLDGLLELIKEANTFAVNELLKIN